MDKACNQFSGVAKLIDLLRYVAIFVKLLLHGWSQLLIAGTKCEW